jgi:hypothetical protein
MPNVSETNPDQKKYGRFTKKKKKIIIIIKKNKKNTDLRGKIN